MCVQAMESLRHPVKLRRGLKRLGRRDERHLDLVRRRRGEPLRMRIGELRRGAAVVRGGLRLGTAGKRKQEREHRQRGRKRRNWL